MGDAIAQRVDETAGFEREPRSLRKPLRVRPGVLACHRDTEPVHAFVLKGRWYYLDHDWIAEQGSYAYEPAGETHTLYVPDDVDQMITLFHVTGGYTYVDPRGKAIG